MGDVRRLRERWADRDYPVLLAAAERLDAGEVPVDVGAIVTDTGLGEDQIVIALKALVPIYLEGKSLEAMGGTVDFFVKALTERGRRTVGLWPSGEDAAAAALDVLQQAENLTDDPEEKTIIRRAGGALAAVSKDVIADVAAALIRQQAGL